MSFTIRPFDRDFAGIVPLLNSVNSEPTTAERLEEAHGNFPTAGLRNRIVAVDGSGRIIGYSNTVRHPTDKLGKFWIVLVVEHSHRRRGVGASLLEEAEAWARRNGGAEAAASILDNDPTSIAFAERRGYRIDRHQFESTLNVSTFDESRFAGVVDGAVAGGIRFFTYAEQPGDETERQLYDLHRATAIDVPGNDSVDFPPFDEWRRWLFEGTGKLMDGIIIAAEGARIAGVTVLQERGDKGGLYTGYTGVHRDSRGRKLALALKLLAVRKAKERKAPYMRTNNDSQNAPMLAVNWKMGYVKSPGQYTVLKQL